MTTDSRTRGHTTKVVVKKCHCDFPKYSFCNRLVNIQNSLPNDVITATSTNRFKNKLDSFTHRLSGKSAIKSL